MSKRKPFLRVLTERGPLIVLAVAGCMLFGIVGPASAQFFNFGFDRRPPPRSAPPSQGGGFFSPFGDFSGQQPPRPADSSRAPAAAKREVPAERNVLVLGDAMADWLAYGLEDALAETPDFGVIRKHKTVSGLIKYQPKGDPADWVAAAKSILATEKPEAIVVMLGLHDRVPIRETEKKADAKDAKDNKDTKKDARGKADAAKPKDPAAANTPVTADDEKAAKPDASASKADDASDDDETPSIMAPENAGRSASGMYNFRDEKWIELYSKKIGEMIAVLKSKGVPVLWVGLPAVRGPKATSDMLFLDSLYREAAGKAGITYVDVWDGFVDEAGRFMQQGPDFEGQIRRLRSSDGVFFTKAGAVKLAHYTEREIRRLLASRTSPVALPADSDQPDATIRPSVAGPRPLVGPMVPLVASNVGTDELLGGSGTRPASVDALAARTLVKGEPLVAPAGRADDFSWPRREVGALDAPAGDPNVAGAAPDGTMNPAKPLVQKRPAPAPAPPSPPVASQGGGFFGFGFSRPSPPPQVQPGQPRPRPPGGFPRPPGNVGPSASAPGTFTR